MTIAKQYALQLPPQEAKKRLNLSFNAEHTDVITDVDHIESFIDTEQKNLPVIYYVGFSLAAVFEIDANSGQVLAVGYHPIRYEGKGDIFWPILANYVENFHYLNT